MISRRKLIGAGAAAAFLGGAAFAFRRRIEQRIDRWTRDDAFAATPPLLAHDPVADRATIHVARGGTPGANVDDVLTRARLKDVIGVDDVVILKVAAQWWNTGMTNVAAVKRTIEAILELYGPAFRGEIIVFENTHFRVPGGASDDPSTGLTRAWTHASAWNVDVDGWTSLGDLRTHFARLDAPVSFVGLIDAGGSQLSGDPWYDPEHAHGVYGGDDRGPIAAGDPRDGYHWDFGKTFRLKKSWVMDAQTPLTWPRFTSPRTGAVVDLRDGVMRRSGGQLTPDGRDLRWLNLTTCNEHGSTGMTGACKSAMGVVDMSAGALGTHPRIRDYQSIHYFGRLPEMSGERAPTWRMAGPLAYFAQHVRKPDLYLTVAEWVAVTPKGGFDAGEDDMRQHPLCRVKTNTIVAGADPVAIDAWCTRNLLHPNAGDAQAMLDLDDPDAKVTKFLRYYRQTAGKGTLDPALVTVA